MASPTVVDTLEVVNNDAVELGTRDPLLDARFTSRNSASNERSPVYKFVLTGGPCAGKTTALSRMSTFFSDKG